MATTPRDWPNRAKEARDRAAEEAARGLRALEPILGEQQMVVSEEVRRVAIAINSFQTILRFLEREGAQTKPN